MEEVEGMDAPGVLVSVFSEDSVDIYDGLDISSSDTTGRPSPSASQLKESMDLYEELVTEEQQNRELMFSELKSRYQAAQNQITELRRRLEKTEQQNTGLNTENFRLKKNISALLRTARLEVSRKDAEIQRLTQQTDRVRHQHPPPMSHFRDQSCSSAGNSKSRAPPPLPASSTPASRRPPPTSRPTPPASGPTPPASRPTPPASRPKPPTSRPPPPASRPMPPASRPTPPTSRPPPPASRPTHPASRPKPPSSQPTSPASRPPPPASQPTSPASRPPPPASQPTSPASRPPPPASQPTSPASRPPPPASQPTPPASRPPPPPPTSRPTSPASRPPPPASQPSPSASRPLPFPSRPPSNPLPPLATLLPLEDCPTRDPSQPSRKESNGSTLQPSGSCVDTKTSTSSSHGLSRSSRQDVDAPDKQTEHWKRKPMSSSAAKHSGPEKHKSNHRDDKGSELTERRHRTGSDPKKRCSTSEKNELHKADRETGQKCDARARKSRNHLNDEGHHRSERARNPQPDILERASSSEKKGRNIEQRQEKVKMSTPDPEHRAAQSSKEGHGHDRRTSKTHGRHNRGGESKDRENYSSSQHAGGSKERTGERLSKDYHRKEDRRNNEGSRKHKRSTSSEKGRENKKRRSHESDQGKVDACGKERKEESEDSSKRSSEETSVTEKIRVEENSPNRKLCFMETLNLTLSPIKKPTLPIDGKQDEPTTPDSVVESGPYDEISQLNIEDMCVVDEVNGSVLETGLEEVAEQPSGIWNAPGPEETQRCDEKHKTAAADKQIEPQPVQTTSDQTQHVDTEKIHAVSEVTEESPESISPKATSVETSEKDKTKPVSESEVDEQGPVDGTAETSRSPPGNQTSNSVRKGKLPHKSVSGHASRLQLTCGAAKTTVDENLPVDAASPPSRENPGHVADKSQSKQITPTVLGEGQQGPCPPASSSIREKDSDAVSSTISLGSVPQEGLSLPEAIFILTQTGEDTNDGGSIPTEPSSSTGCIGVSKVSSTTEESTSCSAFGADTPKKSFGPGKREENNSEPSSSVPLLHDEDSMMRTLSDLKRIPDAISPLRSPIRFTKRSHLHGHAKPGHVKSLEKDFTPTTSDANSKKLDVNKENKYPANHDSANSVVNVSEPASSLSDTELEEGEIVSESDETASGSPPPATKRAKLAQPIKNKPSPKTLLKRISKEANETAGGSTTSPKSRFKSVCPAATKSSFSSIEQVMETFRLVRAEIRKKFMKLHKTFPKKSFYGVMGNFRESFLEFVDRAQFDQISTQQADLKSKLKKLVVSVFGKVSNNGIVKRIFEQQAVDLKQKLWDFVDGQVEFLFREIYTTLKSLPKPTRGPAEDKSPRRKEQVSRQPPANKPLFKQIEAHSLPAKPNQIRSGSVLPYRTGLGSRGKDIRITQVDKDQTVDKRPSNCPNKETVVNLLPPNTIPSTPQKNSMPAVVVSQNGSALDKTDFELLTEQQTSSLTFNLVRDTQMGEIFKCLLQGSDLLEPSTIPGENTAWSLATPKKEGERFLSITTPTKFDSPSRLIAAWSSISPRKMSSPRFKDRLPLNPALFDESCLLELPTDNRVTLQSYSASQRTYSILADDLAVSLTIPSPLKSDSHLSFLQQTGVRIVSTPDSVISAHISEDALLDGEDATEQDIHLALDTDISSCNSSSSLSSEVLATPFVFKPDLPMQALVMEKSNDHFIVKIRQAARSADSTLVTDGSLDETLKEGNQPNGEDSVESQDSLVLSDKFQDGTLSNAAPSINNLSIAAASSGVHQGATNPEIHVPEDENLALTAIQPREEDDSNPHITSEDSPGVLRGGSGGPNLSYHRNLSEPVKDLPEGTLTETCMHYSEQSSDQFLEQFNPVTIRESSAVSAAERRDKRHREEVTTVQQSPSGAGFPESGSPPHSAEGSGKAGKNQKEESHVGPEGLETEESDSERRFNRDKDKCCTPEEIRRHLRKSGKRKKHQEKSKAKRSRRKEEESSEEIVYMSKGSDGDSRLSPASASNQSLHAKNVVKKKGEVVMSWTRDEDRAILIELKTKGASRETFSALSEKLDRPSAQIAQRFYQLMKLFKKMDP